MTPEKTALYFEDFRVGAEWVTQSHHITAAEIAQFAELTGDDNPLHVDPAAARAAGFSDVIAHGLLIQSLSMGLIAELGIMRGTTIALVGMQTRFVSPAGAGSSIHSIVRISSKRLSRGGRSGVLYRKITTVDQSETVLVEARSVNLMRLKPADAR